MNILRFIMGFPSKMSCKSHFREQREKGGKNHYWLHAKWQWQCEECDFRTTLKSGSIMDGSKVDFHT